MVSFILPGNSATGSYEVANSCRFNSGSTDHLDRTFGSAGNRRTFTVSFWLKTTTKETCPAGVSKQAKSREEVGLDFA